MRKVKFRGWDATGQKGWVYGDLVHNKKVCKKDPFLRDRVMVGGYEVVPESVGFCCEMKDSAGKEIFLGDIVFWSRDSKKYLIVWRDGMFYADVENNNDGVYGGFPLWYLCMEAKCTVVGNIYEKN